MLRLLLPLAILLSSCSSRSSELLVVSEARNLKVLDNGEAIEMSYRSKQCRGGVETTKTEKVLIKKKLVCQDQTFSLKSILGTFLKGLGFIFSIGG